MKAVITSQPISTQEEGEGGRMKCHPSYGHFILPLSFSSFDEQTHSRTGNTRSRRAKTRCTVADISRFYLSRLPQTLVRRVYFEFRLLVAGSDARVDSLSGYTQNTVPCAEWIFEHGAHSALHTARRRNCGPDRQAPHPPGIAMDAIDLRDDARQSGLLKSADPGAGLECAGALVFNWMRAGIRRACLSIADSVPGREKGFAQCNCAQFNPVSTRPYLRPLH